MGRVKFKQLARPDMVSDQEWWLALEVTAKYIAKRLEGHMNGGAFDESVFGMPAPEYFSKIAFEKLYTGEWEWRSNRAVHTQLIRIALSDMHHHIEEWMKHTPIEKVEIDEQLSEHLAEDEVIMDLVYEKAEEAAKGDQELLDYIEAVRLYNDYDSIAEKLTIDKRDVYQRQRKLIRRLQIACK